MLPKVGTTLGGKYALEAVIGRGGMGAVYRAKNLLTGRRVALKWILPSLNGSEELRARLFREARAMGRIEHPNVCAVYDVGEDGDAIYLVMELLAGRTLRAILEERRPDVTEVVQILLSAMQGVAAAHAAGVVHRDLKPDNLFVCEEDGVRGATKVLDFGVSKILDLRESDGLTKSGMAVGTPHYMSPEQIIGSKEVDERSDVYGLGAILYQALTGRLPFEADNYSALVVQIAMTSPEPLEKHASAEGAPLAPVVHRALARQPADRFQSVVELARALEPFAGGARFETPRPRPRSEPPPPALSTPAADAGGDADAGGIAVEVVASESAPTNRRSDAELLSTIVADAASGRRPVGDELLANAPPLAPPPRAIGPLAIFAVGLAIVGAVGGGVRLMTADVDAHEAAAPPARPEPSTAARGTTSAVIDAPSALPSMRGAPDVEPPPREAATRAPSPPETPPEEPAPPAAELVDRLPPLGARSRARQRVGREETPAAPTEEPTRARTDPPTDVSTTTPMTATGRSGTISTSDFE